MPRPSFAPLRGGAALRWGILAPGAIADKWASAVLAHTDQRIVAVGSRSPERARAFAARHGIERAHGDYAHLLADPQVDIVYVAAPNSEHHALALAAIRAGKHVLVEKPLAVDVAQAREIAAAARAAGVFAGEGMWSRFLPQASVVAQLLDDGVLGEVVLVQADLGVRMPFDAASRAFDPLLGGGALLDLGIYPVWFAHSVLGAPSDVVARGSLAPTGVDAHSSVVLRYESGALASVTSSFLAATPRAAAITGTLGRIEYAGSFKDPSALRLTVDGRSLEWRDESGIEGSDGLCYQAAAVASHIAKGELELSEHDLADTIAVLGVLESAREQLGAR